MSLKTKPNLALLIKTGISLLLPFCTWRSDFYLKLAKANYWAFVFHTLKIDRGQGSFWQFLFAKNFKRLANVVNLIHKLSFCIFSMQAVNFFEICKSWTLRLSSIANYILFQSDNSSIKFLAIDLWELIQKWPTWSKQAFELLVFAHVGCQNTWKLH